MKFIQPVFFAHSCNTSTQVFTRCYIDYVLLHEIWPLPRVTRRKPLCTGLSALATGLSALAIGPSALVPWPLSRAPRHFIPLLGTPHVHVSRETCIELMFHAPPCSCPSMLMPLHVATLVYLNLMYRVWIANSNEPLPVYPLYWGQIDDHVIHR